MSRLSHREFESNIRENAEPWPASVAEAAAALIAALRARDAQLSSAAARQRSEQRVCVERATLDALAAALERCGLPASRPDGVGAIDALEDMMVAAGSYGSVGDADVVAADLRLSDALFAARR